MIKEKVIPYKTIIFVIIFITAFAIFSKSLFLEKTEALETGPKPVKVITASETTIPITAEYIGVVESDNQKKLGFKTSGKLEKFYHNEGDVVSAGDALASLDKNDANRAYQASQNTMENAKEAYNFMLKNYQKLQKLQEAGGLSEQELERKRIELENQKTSYENSKIDFENKASLVNDVVLRADSQGVISKVLFEEGEIVPAGQPVIVMNSSKGKINTALSQKDISLINLKTETNIFISGENYPGKILSINSIPDPATRTYPVELEIAKDASEKNIPIGSLVTIKFNIRSQKAITLPLPIISNDGQDFVFVIDENNQVLKKTITHGQVQNNQVIVYGLEDGDHVVSEGFGNIKQGEVVRIKN